MKLDPRIMKRPFTPWDRKEFLQFIRSHDGKMTIPGYFANSFQAFCDLSNFADFDSAIGVLSAVMDIEYPFSPGKDKWYQFFLPDEWVKEPEKKYRPFTLAEWIERHGIGEEIHYRSKSEGIELRHIYTGYAFNKGKDITKPNIGTLTLGVASYSFDYLLEDYEIEINNEWQPFGVEDTE